MNTPQPESEQSEEKPVSLRVPKAAFLISLLMLAVLIVLVYTHRGDTERFALTLERAEPGWLVLAVLLQLGTYCCVGAIWGQVARSGGHHLRFGVLVRLAVEKLTVDQLMPTVGMAGNLAVARAMRRYGLPGRLAMEALIIDILSRYAAYLVVAVITVTILWLHHDVTPLVRWLLAAFAVIATNIPLTIWWLLRHRKWHPPGWLGRSERILRLLDAVSRVSPDRIGSPKLVTLSGLLQMAIFFLDAGTLWSVLRAIGISAPPITAFAALVMASIAGTVSFLPGGIGSFEAGSTATLTLLGIPIEAALTGTLLLRGLTLWLPLIPGFIMARHDMAFVKQKSL